MVKEIASVVDQFHGDPAVAPVHDFYRLNDLLVSPGVSEVLQEHCNSERILGRTQQSERELCSAGKIESLALVKRAIHLLGPSLSQPILFAVVLHSATGRADLAADAVRLAPNSLIQRCECFSSAYDDLVQKRRTASRFLFCGCIEEEDSLFQAPL